jgi:hypothetical protein
MGRLDSPETSLVVMSFPAKLGDAKVLVDQPLDRNQFLLPEYRNAPPQQYQNVFVSGVASIR